MLNHFMFKTCCYLNLTPTHFKLIGHNNHKQVKLVQHSHLRVPQVQPLTRHTSIYVHKPETNPLMVKRYNSKYSNSSFPTLNSFPQCTIIYSIHSKTFQSIFLLIITKMTIYTTDRQTHACTYARMHTHTIKQKATEKDTHTIQ